MKPVVASRVSLHVMQEKSHLEDQRAVRQPRRAQISQGFALRNGGALRVGTSDEPRQTGDSLPLDMGSRSAPRIGKPGVN